MELTSRELATLIVIVVFVLLCLWLNQDRKKLLGSLLKVVKAFGAWKVWTVVLSYLIFVTIVIVIAHLTGAWTTRLLKDTLIITFFVGLPILFNSADFKNGVSVVKHVVRQVIGVAALLVVYLNLVTFPLWVEIVLQISLSFFVMLAIVGKNDTRTASIGKRFEVLTGLVGIGLISYVTVQVATRFSEFDWEQEGTSFALSVWLPVSLIPFIYLFGLIASCEATLLRAKIHNGREALPLSVRFAFLVGVRGSLRYANSFNGRWLWELTNRNSFRSASKTMRAYRQSVRANAQDNRERRRRLKRQASRVGADEYGLWFDRREIHETKEALESLFYKQMGLYRHRGGRYWTDPIVVFPLGGFRNLPDDHGVHFRVRDDGQAWVAWRQTVGGLFLGVGGTQDLEAYWRYAGREQPSNYPGFALPGWVDVLKDIEASPEWDADDAPLPEA